MYSNYYKDILQVASVVLKMCLIRFTVQLGVSKLQANATKVRQVYVSFVVDRSPKAVDGGVTCQLNLISQWGDTRVRVLL